jgi:hypothetical protein
MNLSKLHDLNLKLQDHLRMQNLDTIQSTLLDMLIEHHRLRDLLRDYERRQQLDLKYLHLGWPMKPALPLNFSEVEFNCPIQ